MERLQVELADPCFGDGKVCASDHAELINSAKTARRGRGRASDRPRQAPARRLQESIAAGMNQSARPSSSATCAAPPGSARRLETGPQVVGSRAARPPLRKAELDQHLRPLAGSICSSSARLRYPTAASAAPSARERSAARRSVETERVGLRGDAEEVPPHPPAARRPPAAPQRPSDARRLVRPHRASRRRRCGRPGGRTRADPPAGGGRAERVRQRPDQVRCFHAGVHRRVAQLGPVAEDRGRAEEGKRIRRQASETKRDGARNAPAPISSRQGTCSANRAGSLPCKRVQHRAHEERVSQAAISRAAQKASSGARPCS